MRRAALLLAAAASLARGAQAAPPPPPRLVFYLYWDLLPSRARAAAFDPAQWKSRTAESRVKWLTRFSMPEKNERVCFLGEAPAVLAGFFEGDARLSARLGRRGDSVDFDLEAVGARSVAACDEGAARALAESAKRSPATLADGFVIHDRVEGRPELRRFVLKLDTPPKKEEVMPWQRPEHRGLDLRKHDDALKFAVLVQKYVYDGMANQDAARPNENFDAFKAAERGRYWCHMPWQNVGVVGREALMGMTKEHDLVAGGIPFYAKMMPGSCFAIGFHNAMGCRTIERAWGTKDAPRDPPDFRGARFGDGTLAFKVLFTQSPDPALKDAFTVKANVSLPYESARAVREVRLIQTDVALRDSRLTGTRPELNNWVFLVFYYDPSYDYDAQVKPLIGWDNPLKSIPGLPAAFLKMRPAGIQRGLDAADTTRFNGAAVNGFENRLNGPEDLSSSSCMSCHSMAGTRNIAPPGYMSNAAWVRAVSGQDHLDFSLQMNHSRRNWSWLTQFQDAPR
jgi:hypothetical protein